MSSEQQSSGEEQIAIDQTKVELLQKAKELTEGIDKNSDGWDAILSARETIYTKFFPTSVADREVEFDREEFTKILQISALQASAKFTFEHPVSYDDCLLLIMAGIDYKWDKWVQKAHTNIEIGNQAVKFGLREVDLSGDFDQVPGFNFQR